MKKKREFRFLNKRDAEKEDIILQKDLQTQLKYFQKRLCLTIICIALSIPLYVLGIIFIAHGKITYLIGFIFILALIIFFSCKEVIRLYIVIERIKKEQINK